MLKVVCTVIGTFVGAGFASGKEIHLFFYRYGYLGIIGIVISTIFIGIILKKTIKIMRKNDVKNYYSFTKKIIKNKKYRDILNKINNVFLIFSFCIMISGFCTFARQVFAINKAFSGTLMLLWCYYIFRKNINKIVKINNFVVPFFLIILLYIFVFKNNNYEFYFFEDSHKNIDLNENIFFDFLIKIKVKFSFLIKAILYSNYNLLGIVPVLIATKKHINKRIYEKIIPLLVTTIICALSFFIIILLSTLIKKNEIEMLNLEMPVIYIVSKYGVIYKYLYIMIIGVAIFTTAVSSGYGYLQKFEYNKKEFEKRLHYLILLAIVFIPIGFSNLINIIYPFFGVVGCMQSYYILKYKE